MKKYTLPNIGEKIQVEILNEFSGVPKKQLTSQVIDIADDNILFIAAPIYRNTILPIEIGKIIKIKYIRQNKGVYIFRARVVGRKKTSKLSYLRVEKIGDIFREQRRDFFRLEITLKLDIKIADTIDAKPITLSGLTKDISGGGLKFVIKRPLQLNSKVEVTLYMEDEFVVMQGRVIRCLPAAEGPNNEYEIGLMYEDIDEATRTKLIAFIFQCQRKMLEKGLRLDEE